MKAISGALLITLVACGGDSGTTSPPGNEASPPAPEQATPRTPGPECKETSELAARPGGENAFQWDPSCIVTSDTSITVTNDDDNLHSFTISGSDVDVDIKPGKTETIDISDATDPDGETYFICKYHHLMDGYVWVV